jgi:hypothetical protein
MQRNDPSAPITQAWYPPAAMSLVAEAMLVAAISMTRAKKQMSSILSHRRTSRHQEQLAKPGSLKKNQK